MDRSMDWPWSWEEEVQWKADLEERDYDFLQELIDNTVEDSAVDSHYSPGSTTERTAGNTAPEKYFVTA
ncbi:MAG TPA: hypothetical protein VMG82_17315 [Candidatus Sulfotelmatobacter sp.]|nr:hypothetical protein [Candidatus Sulfotelmatobacter sp.]